MHRVILVALLLAGCAKTPTPDTYRNPTAPISSIALFDPARIAGEWREVASFRQAGPCLICQARFTTNAEGLALQSVAGTARLVPSGPGRLAVQGLPGDLSEPWWVLWVDADYRTLVIGTPSGRFGAVLDRGRIGPDRMKAATEILDWAGYDTARLRPAQM
ncbi:lipocalin family protein [Vannielia litorea]|uniref:Apolipoprotein D and lipocalin family protein n=1 Tax=Vannielia litorea TaxID=1217970 RepID=A0A1N6GEX7_9RHOB|nr:lipocalin family protein [Vannielia litorea]SIO06051.1 apolipoprotein D and lipocalin family protein [Vannielia litorea]